MVANESEDADRIWVVLVMRGNIPFYEWFAQTRKEVDKRLGAPDALLDDMFPSQMDVERLNEFLARMTGRLAFYGKPLAEKIQLANELIAAQTMYPGSKGPIEVKTHPTRDS